MAAHCIQPSEHDSAFNIVDNQSEKRKKKRKKKKEPSYSVNGEVIWNDNIWDDNELTYYRRLREFWSTLCINDRIRIASLEKESVVLKMKEQQRITCNCDCCTQERREFEIDVEECFALYHDELIRVEMRNDYGERLSHMPLEECTLNDTEFVFYWSLSSDGHQICVNPELVEGGALFIDLLESSQYDEVDEDFYDRDFEDIQEATDDLTEVQLAWARLLVGRKFFQTFIARMFEERLLVAYREKLAYDKQQKLIAEEEEEERLKKERDENRQLARQRKRDRKKEQKKAAADRKKAEDDEIQKAEKLKLEKEILQKLDEDKKRKDKRRITRPLTTDCDDQSSNSSGSRSSSVERALMENIPEQAKLPECLKKKVPTPVNDNKKPPEVKVIAKPKPKENKAPVVIESPINIIPDVLKVNDNNNDSTKSKKRRRKKNNRKQDNVDSDIMMNNTNIPGSSSIIKKEESKTARAVLETTPSNMTTSSNRVSPPNITKAAPHALPNNTSPDHNKPVITRREQTPAPAPKFAKQSTKPPPKPLQERPIQIPIPPIKCAPRTNNVTVLPKNVTIKKTQSQVITTTTVASTAAPGYERSMNTVTVSSFVTMTTTQAMQILNSHVSSTSSLSSTTQSVWGNTSPISSLLSDPRTPMHKPRPEIDPGAVGTKTNAKQEEPRVPTPKAIGSERAAVGMERAIGSERAKILQKDALPLNGISESNCSPFATSNQPFFLGLQRILSSAKTTETSPGAIGANIFNSGPGDLKLGDFGSGFPSSWSTQQPSLWSSAQPNNMSVSSSLDSSNSSRSSPEVSSLWMQPPPSQTPPWNCAPIGTPKIPITPPPPNHQQQQNAAGMTIPGIIHIPRSLALQANPNLSPFQAFSGLDQRGVRQSWTPVQKLHAGFELRQEPMRPS